MTFIAMIDRACIDSLRDGAEALDGTIAAPVPMGIATVSVLVLAVTCPSALALIGGMRLLSSCARAAKDQPRHRHTRVRQ